jgi:LPXTG-motif cell wall-anchored protein
MEHPVKYLERVTRSLDQLIEDQGIYLFLGFTWLCLGIIAWIFVRRRKHATHNISVHIVPLCPAPRREPEQDPPPFEEHSGL